jgi:hypothetical protein
MVNFINPVSDVGADQYETVAASQTAQVLGPTGAAGDFLRRRVDRPRHHVARRCDALG